MCPTCKASKEVLAFNEAVKIAKLEAKSIKGDAVVYEYKGKFYGECKACWEKAGKIGKLLVTIFYS